MSFSTRQDWVSQAAWLIQNERAGVGLDHADLLGLAASVNLWLSRHRPYVKALTFSGTGSAVDFPTSGSLTDAAYGWVPGLSTLRWVEHPTGDDVRSFLDPDEYELFPDPMQPTAIHFETAPASGSSNVRAEITTIHTVSDTTTTVESWLQPGWEFGLAHAACKVYAARYGHTTDPTVEADSVNYGGKLGDWLKLAEAMLEQASLVFGMDLSAYGEGGGGGAGSSGPAGGWQDYDPPAGQFGNLLFRSRKRR